MAKFAVVIGVDKTGELPPLRSAAAGASTFAKWLEAEDFEVDLITDLAGPVRAEAIFARINAVCQAGTYEQLLVYFSGHGYLNDGSEHWLLSGAPLNANEAVSLLENVELARECGIPNVVFVSDACRSTPESLKADRVRGSIVFPNFGVSRTCRADVDRLLASLPGDPAYEVPVESSTARFRSLYTTCLINAFVDPSDHFCRRINGVEVVPTRSLKKLLPPLVEKAAPKASSGSLQMPDTIVESDDSVYIARASRTQAGSSRAPASDEAPGSSRGIGKFRRFKNAFGRFGGLIPSTVSRSEDLDVVAPQDRADILVAEALRSPEALGSYGLFDGAIDAASRLPDVGIVDFDGGVAVRGVEVVEVRGIGCKAHLTSSTGRGTDAFVRVEASPPSSDDPFPNTVLLRFADGAGTAVAALGGFVCSVGVDYAGGGKARTDGVVQVAYTPAREGAYWPAFAAHRESIDLLRAVFAGLARKGVFRISPSQARSLVNRTRPGAMTDPTLGLFAAYALDDIGMSDEVRGLAGRLRSDLGGKLLYDVALLGRGDGHQDSRLVSPFCPMLSRGWQLLRVYGGELPSVVVEAGSYRRATLWTTFEKGGMDILFAGGAS